MREETEKATALRHEIEAQLEERQAQVEEATRKAIACMERELASRKAVADIRKEKLALLEKMDSSAAENASLRAQVDSQSQELTALQSRLTESQLNAENRIRSLEQELKHNSEQLLQAVAQDKSASRTVKDLQEQITKLQASHTAAADAQRQLEAEKSTLTTQLTAAQKEATSARAQIQSLEKALREQRDRRAAEEKEHASRIADVESARARAEAQVAELSKSHGETVASHRAALASATTAQENLRKQLAESEKTRQDLQTHLEEVDKQKEQQLQALQQQLEAVKKRAAEDKERAATANTEAMDALRAATADAVARAVGKALQHPAQDLPSLQVLLSGCASDLQNLKRAAFSTSRSSQQAGQALNYAVNAAAQLGYACCIQQREADAENLPASHPSREGCKQAAAAVERAVSALLTPATTGSDKAPPEAEQALQQALQALKTLEEQSASLDNVLQRRTNVLEEQMAAATGSVEDAEARIAALLESARQALDEGQLAVHEGILDQSMALMRLIKQLIVSAGHLQREIVAAETAAGKGPTNAAQFYKRNSRWVEGLVSAAKAVGGAATATVDAADRAIAGRGKLEELMVCGQEIAASTAQLVVVSRVKAKPESKKKAVLEKDSQEVYDATQKLIAVVRDACVKTRAAQTAEDYLKLSLVQAKRLQMDSQIRVLELESELMKEQERLRQLRKAHFQLSEQAEVGGDEGQAAVPASVKVGEAKH